MPSAFEILALTGWAADRNDLAMRGARAFAQHVEARTGAPLREIRELAPGPVHHRPWAEALAHAAPYLRGAAAAVSDVVGRGRPALICENRCAASVATIAAGLALRPELAVLYLDAQADFNTPASTTSGYLGGMVISALCGLWDSGFGAGLEPGRLVLAGSRDIDPEEHVLLAEHGVRVRDVADAAAIAEDLRGRAVWIHVDLDVLEPGHIPTEYRAPGGPGPEHVRQLLAAVAETSDIVALEVAEYEHDPDQAALHAARLDELIAPVLARWQRAAGI